MLKHHCLLISDFNAEILARILCNDDEDQAAIDVLTAPYGQVFQSLSSNTQSQSGIVWTLPEKVFPLLLVLLILMRLMLISVLMKLKFLLRLCLTLRLKALLYSLLVGLCL